MATYENQRDVGSIYKNNLENVKVSVADVGGKHIVDVRVYAGDTATRKGLCLQPKAWAELLPIIQQALNGKIEEGAVIDEPTSAY
jgi:hypothetical protein